jgi:hypothetical protein
MPSTAAVRHQSPPTVVPVGVRDGHQAPGERASTPRRVLELAALGYLVPSADFMGRVHSVFAGACNVTCDDTLLTIAAYRAGDGPVTLRLADGAAPDLRIVFDAGESVRCCGGVLRSVHIDLSLRKVRVWRPVEPARRLAPARIDARLAGVAASLARCGHAQSSILEREGAATAAALSDACRALDVESGVRHAARLIGWGEGLTPAGDDFLVGLLAGLDASVEGDERRGRMRSAIAATVASSARQTTPIAAHYLKLAAGGHYNEPLLNLRNALLAEDDRHVVDAALRRALSVGASSGADTVRGLLAGLSAWPRAAAARQ